MTRRAASIVIGLVAVALVGVALLAVPSSPLHKEALLGLDLQGGLEVTLKAVPPRDRQLTKDDLDRSVEIMRNRVDRLGVSEPEIRTQGDDQIAIQLPGVKDPEAAAKIIGKTAQLQLYDLETSLTGPSIDARGIPIAYPRAYDLLARVQSLANRGTPEQWYVFDAKRKLVVGPVTSRNAALSRFDGTLPKGHKLFGVPEKTIVITCGASAVVCPPGEQGNARSFYLFKFEPPSVPQMTGSDLKLSGTRADFDTSPGGAGAPIVTMEFTGAGADKFQDITRAEWIRGRIRQAPQHFAIVLDGEIRTWPQIDYTDNTLSGGIGGGRAQIEGLESLDEAKEIAIVLQTGALPVRFTTLDQTAISATLGKDSLEEAKVALLAGLILVVVFLLAFYRFLGLVAVVGLGIYGAFLYAAILLFNVTLTLPGFAGLVLTLGVAADANVVIFERVKEEARAGRSVRAAIQTGYTKGFATIVDANVVTALTAMILFAIATSGVRGFALLLLIGTGISIITAVFATRALLALLAGFKWFDNPAFMGASQREIPRWQRIDIVGRRRLWFTIAGVLIAASIGSLLVKGLNLGIDFEGGSQVSFRTPQPVQLQDVRAKTPGLALSDAVQGRGDPAPNGGYRSFAIRTETLEPAQQETLTSALEREFDATALGVRNVSASFSEQILRGAIVAMIVSFVLISLYVSIRFEWRFAVPILRTIVNDGLIAMGIYSLSGREVTASTVAAFLTIIGYSIYDTMIIFDRVRENIPLMRRSSIARIINVSLWETIPRSLVTTFITLLPVSALFVFGGDTLKDFAFAILVGISISAFSTIFIAAPFLAVLKEREPEYRRRKEARGADEEAVSVGGVLLTPKDEEDEGPGGQPVVPPRAPAPVPSPAAATLGGVEVPSSAKRERRRQRRSSRPHGRAR